MLDKIVVSVIMCVYNTKQAFLIDAVLSVLRQTYSNFELLIVDDNSSEELYSHNIFKDDRIKIIKNESNRGPSFCRNRALELAKGKYIAIMDSDDISLPDRFEKQVDFLEKNKNVVACGSYFRFIGRKEHTIARDINDFEYYRCCLLFDNNPTILNSSVMIRKSVMDFNNIKWDESLRLGEDYLLWVRLSEHGIITNYPEVLVCYRVHNEQLTSKANSVKRDTTFVCQYQLKKIGSNIPKYEAKFLNLHKISSIKQLNEVQQVINNVISYNSVAKYYDQGKLVIRSREYIDKIINSSSTIILFVLLFKRKYHSISRLAIKRRIKKLFICVFVRKNNY